MNKLITKVSATFAVLATVASTFTPFTARAAEAPPFTVKQGDWSISELAYDSAGWRVESYKVDRGLVAWTELSSDGKIRRIHAFDGVKSRLLAEFPSSDWDNQDYFFVENVNGFFDAADGKVVWVMKDGSDREIFVFDGDAVKKVSDNTYDDRHPVTGGGRVAWTSYPSANQYNLMVREADGRLQRLASWHILNYAFSGKNLYWQERQKNESWFSVLRNDGKLTVVVGKGDDRPLISYFLTDGNGTAAWEYSTKRWDYDKREAFISHQGNPALRVMQRDVPPRSTRLEDVNGTNLIVNVFDWQYTRFTDRNALIETDFAGEHPIWERSTMSKVRYMDGGYVMQREPDANISLVFQGATSRDVITTDPVIKDLFDADGPSAAGARTGGGMYLYSNGQTELFESGLESTSVIAHGGDVAWTEGTGNDRVLKFASKTVTVSSAYGTKRVSGYLIKSSESKAVYLAAEDGKRYLFPGSQHFYDWYGSFSSVRTVAPATLAKLPLAGNVMFRGGQHLLKTTTASKVYAVGDNGRIHALANESIAQELFGKDWKARIIMIGDSQLSAYSVGPSISDRLTYVATLAKQTSR